MVQATLNSSAVGAPQPMRNLREGENFSIKAVRLRLLSLQYHHNHHGAARVLNRRLLMPPPPQIHHDQHCQPAGRIDHTVVYRSSSRWNKTLMVLIRE